jgi:pimeloyl-ACP methyl ester carboxylesterase
MIRVLSLAALGLAVCYGAWLSALWYFQERVVFQPPAGGAPTDVDARQVHYRTVDGIQLFAYVVGNCTPTSRVVIAFHGNADLARWLVPWATTAAIEANACVVLPEYRGYDGLAGRPTYAGSAYDARAALDYIRTELGVSPDNAVYFGHSLGSAIAAELAAHEPPRVLMLESPLSSARGMAERMLLPGLTTFWSVISRVHFDTIERVRALSSQVWVAHGDRDAVVPVQMGREVFAAARNKGELLIVPGASHSDVATVGGRAYWNWFRRALFSGATSPTDRDVPAEMPPAP